LRIFAMRLAMGPTLRPFVGVGPRGFGGTLSEVRRVRGVDSLDWPCGQDSG
jgi:hypothetical protein